MEYCRIAFAAASLSEEEEGAGTFHCGSFRVRKRLEM